MKEATQKYSYEKVADQLTVDLRTQHKHGDMFPSENQLSKKFNVTRTTIRRALDVLEEQGLVERFHRRGTVVKDPLVQGEFAVVIRPKLLEDEASPSYRKRATFLSEKMGTKNERWHTKLHLGKKVDSELNAGELFPPTLDLLEPDVLKRLRGVFTFQSLFELTEQLRQKNIPVVGIGGTVKKADASVTEDRETFYRASVNHLRQVGCKTVGVMWNHMDKPLQPEERIDRHFAKLAIDAGLTVKEQWLFAVINSITERKSYETFIKFWEQGDCPDGVVIIDDVVAKGVLRAVLHKGIRVPEQIRLITFANKGIELPFHKPVTRYEFDMEEEATLAVEAMVKLVEAQEIESKRIFVQGKLIKGETT